MSTSRPSWTELLGRMAAVSFDSATGSVSYREVRDDGVVEEGSVAFWFRRNGFMRIDGENGIKMLDAGGTTLVRDHLGKMQQLDGIVSWGGHGNPRQLLGGPDAARNLSNPNDCSAPTGGAETAEIDGRSGWRFTLAPPGHKQYPLEVVIDDETAALLEMRSVGLDSYIRLADFQPDADIDDTVFVYDGRIATDLLDEQRRHREVARLQRDRHWPAPRYWPTGLTLELLNADSETGAFVGLLEGAQDGAGAVLARWRDVGPPKQFERFAEGLHVHQWTRDSFNWALATPTQFSDRELARIVDSIPDDS